MILTDNFSREEFDSHDGSAMPQIVLDNIGKLATNLQTIRDFFNASITINSGYRSPEHNKSVGGAKHSQHLLGTASDIVVSGYTRKEVADAIEGLIRIGAISDGGLGRYGTFTHYDIRDTHARWNG